MYVSCLGKNSYGYIFFANSTIKSKAYQTTGTYDQGFQSVAECLASLGSRCLSGRAYWHTQSNLETFPSLGQWLVIRDQKCRDDKNYKIKLYNKNRFKVKKKSHLST